MPRLRDTPTVPEAFKQKKETQPGQGAAGQGGKVPLPWGPGLGSHGPKGRGLLTGRWQWCGNSHTERPEPTEAAKHLSTDTKPYQLLPEALPYP